MNEKRGAGGGCAPDAVEAASNVLEGVGVRGMALQTKLNINIWSGAHSEIYLGY